MKDLSLDLELTKKYISVSQRIRVLSENWVLRNVFCPKCGNQSLSEYENNKPVADFFCTSCESDYELKSKSGKIGTKIVDGAYNKMIDRITSLQNPNFLFLNYSDRLKVNNLLAIPNVFFTPELIEKRNPLNFSARRAGWIGCNILFSRLPEKGKIFIIKNGKFQEKKRVIESWSKVAFLKEITLKNRGWLVEIMKCVDLLRSARFKLEELYQFENQLSIKFPMNNNIKPKIRQQLQLLRDHGYVEFQGKGNYKILQNEQDN